MVTGSGGQLGSELRAAAARYPRWNFRFFSHAELDVTDAHDVRQAMRQCSCDVLVNCAAFTSVDRAEADPGLPFRVNRDGAGVLAGSARELDALLVHFSTYYVFDGMSPKPFREQDEPRPLGVYGLSKRQGEELIGKIGPSHMIIRTGWLYSPFGQNFVKTMHRLGRERDVVDVVSDRVGSPTCAEDLAEAVLCILGKADLQRSYAETYHYVNEGACSWYDLAAAVMSLAGLPCRVRPIESSGFSVSGPRPWYSVLNNNAVKREWELVISHWQASLGRTLERMTVP